MANEEQLSILRQGVEVWNGWREENPGVGIVLTLSNLIRADLDGANLIGANLSGANLVSASLKRANLTGANLAGANLVETDLDEANLSLSNLNGAILCKASLHRAHLSGAILVNADLTEANLEESHLYRADLSRAKLSMSRLFFAYIGSTIFGNVDLSLTMGLNSVDHGGPSTIGMDMISHSKGKIPEVFLRGCGLSDTDIEYTKLYDPDLSNEEINKILYRMYDLRATQALQISPLFISYSHTDNEFVDRIGDYLTEKGIRYWRDIHDMKSGRIEVQIDRAIRQNPTVLLVLSKHSLVSDWVEHEIRTARDLEKEMDRDVLCPVALDDSWKSSRWPKRVLEQIMEYNILDFSEWRDDSKFDGMFRKLIDGLELFYKA